MTSIRDSVQPIASHFINGQYVDDPGGTPFTSICPLTGDIIAELNGASDDVVGICFAAAQSAQEAWARLSGAERGRILRKAADLIRKSNRELSLLETRDTGKPLQETLCADALSGANCLEFFGGIAASIAGEFTQLGESFFLHETIAARGMRRHRRLELSLPECLLESGPCLGLR